jgi:peptide-methionine (S)-S-oxide reductase
MTSMRKLIPVAALAVVAFLWLFAGARSSAAVALPAPAVDMPRAAAPGAQTVVVAGGCFWGVEAVFRHVKGVAGATSGYAGGSAATAHYELVSDGGTGHAESVRVTFDPAQVSLGELLQVFFSVAHDPTEVNRQGPDTGTQYRSAIFVSDPAQKRVVDAYIAQLEQAKVFPRHIATEVAPLAAFYPAEAYHQNYAALHPASPYIMINDAPKVGHLKKLFPALYRAP